MSKLVVPVLFLSGIVVVGAIQAAPSQQRALLTSRRSTHETADEDQGSVRGSTKLVVNHLPKCGGLFAKAVLGRGNVQHFKLEREQDSVTQADAKEFVVGMVRNPLDYYVSHWAYLSTGRFSSTNPPHDYLKKHYPSALTNCAQDGCGFNSGEKKAFNHFVQTVCTESIGQMSLRFWGSYVGTPANGNFHNVPVVQDYVASQRGFGKNESEMLQTIVEDLENVPSLSKLPVDCWVKQENLEADMFKCLEMYEKTPGSGKVDWEAIRGEMASNSTYENSSPHASCNDMYDKDTLKMVVKADKHLFDLFGFPRHCLH